VDGKMRGDIEVSREERRRPGNRRVGGILDDECSVSVG
jgi:hypothetical protein